MIRANEGVAIDGNFLNGICRCVRTVISGVIKMNNNTKHNDMLKIDQIGNGPKETILILKGKLMGNTSTELKKISEQYLKKGKSFSMDLADVRFIDFFGMKMIEKLTCHKNVQVINCPYYITKMIEKFKCV